MLDRRAFLLQSGLGLFLPQVMARTGDMALRSRSEHDGWDDLWAREHSYVCRQLRAFRYEFLPMLLRAEPSKLESRIKAMVTLRRLAVIDPAVADKVFQSGRLRQRYSWLDTSTSPNDTVRPGVDFDWQVRGYSCCGGVNLYPVDRAKLLLAAFRQRKLVDLSEVSHLDPLDQLAALLPTLEYSLRRQALTGESWPLEWYYVVVSQLADFEPRMALRLADANRYHRAAAALQAKGFTLSRFYRGGFDRAMFEHCHWLSIQAIACNHFPLLGQFIPRVAAIGSHRLLSAGHLVSIYYQKVRTLVAWRTGRLTDLSAAQTLPPDTACSASDLVSKLVRVNKFDQIDVL